MTTNQTLSKPPSVEEPREEGLDGTTCCVSSIRAEAAEVLKKMRADKQPTRRGILLCGEMMGKMLMLGWDKDDLNTFEIMFWATRDADGRLLKSPHNAATHAPGVNEKPLK